MPFDINSTATLLRAVEAMPPESSFLYDMFCVDGGMCEESKAIYDYRKGNRQMAPFVTPGVGGVELGRAGFETREIGFCCIAPERTVDKSMIETRAYGENVLGAMTPEQRSRKQVAKDMVEMRGANQNRREWMALRMLTTGKLEIFAYTDEGRSKVTTSVADFHFTNFHTAATKWSDGSAKIIDDMMRIDDIVQEGGGYVDIRVMAPDVASAILHNSELLKQLDTKALNIGELNVKYRGYGLRYLGRDVDGVDLFSLSATYTDDDRKVKPFLPSGTMISGSKGMLKFLHGPVTLVKDENAANHTTYIKKEVPERFAYRKSASIVNRLTSCPTIMPENVDGWVVSHVL